MIIGRDEIHDVGAFRTGLDAAARTVVRVRIETEGPGTGGFCTGWAVTPELLVVPGFLMPGGVAPDEMRFHCDRGGAVTEARLVHRIAGDRMSTAAVLKLEEPLNGPPLPLSGTEPDVGDQLFVVQYPLGAPRLKFSMGRALARGPRNLHYDADTRPGSGGGPVLDGRWAVVGMHMASGDGQFNEGLPLAGILDDVRASPPTWRRIASERRLADVDAMKLALETPPEPPGVAGALLEAAVRWSLDPSALSPGAAAQLEPLVAKSASGRWMLPPDQRIEALSGSSLGDLRRARGAGDGAGDGDGDGAPEPGQRVIDRILAGPPYSLDDQEEALLPYWLQATRWFAAVPELHGLPTPDEIVTTLERRRIRSRLELVGDRGFRGRDDELAALRAWWEDPAAGPFVITGIGGIGKSALVAHFVLRLPPDTLQLWLDFDRADLAPDDPASVLRVLFEQLDVQLDGFVPPPLAPDAWPDALARLGPALAPVLPAGATPLLVLDGFEIAQHAVHHREIWRLLEQLLPQLPGLRILVSGRAPVGELVLDGRAARQLHLEGLAEGDAVRWLLEHGFETEHIAGRVAAITRGVPLGLRLAARWRAEGGEIDELPERGAPQWLVDGFLYGRILDRVVDPALKPLARDVLVLRRLTPPMIPAVLHDSAPPGLETDEVFARIAREMALVGDGAEGHGLDALALTLPGSGVLRLRPEVRAATLQLLMTDDAARVRAIDERAVAWYASLDADDATNAAELVYHRLRLGDVEGAKRAWRDGCAPLLLYAERELPEEDAAARSWLEGRTHEAPSAASNLVAWELDARDQIQALLQRGVARAVPPLLAERRERSAESPLLIYDALVRHWDRDASGARALLAAAPPVGGPVGRDRAVVAAWLAAEEGDGATAERLLRKLDRPSRWPDRPEAALDALTAAAARVRLTVDLEAELRLAELLQRDPAGPLQAALDAVLPPVDVVLPFLSDRVGSKRGLEALGEGIPIPREPEELPHFAVHVEAARRQSTRGYAMDLSRADRDERAIEAAWRDDRLADAMATPASPEYLDGVTLGLDLAILGRRRWSLATRTLFLTQASRLAVRLDPGGDMHRRSIVGALAAFAGHEQSSFRLIQPRMGPLVELLGYAGGPVPARPSHRPAREAVAVLRFLGAATAAAAVDEWIHHGEPPPRAVRELNEIAGSEPWLRGLLFLLLGPDPLESLVRRVAVIPDTMWM